MTTAEYQLQNEYLWDKAIEKNPKLAETYNTYLGWKVAKRFVRKGQKSQKIRVQSGYYKTVCPITGEDEFSPKFVNVDVFHISQTDAK